jgi:16S rRNA (uracil1498-N3)-methyltransferase
MAAWEVGLSEPMFYCESLLQPGGTVRLQGDEARHASASRRLGVGDTVRLFDGRGGIAHGKVRALHDRGREIDVSIDEHTQQEAPHLRVHVACALPKGDRASTLIDMATQLGMTSFIPLLCERSVVDPGAGTLERLRRVSLEACKQSRRAYLPQIHEPIKFIEVFARSGTVWIAHPDGEPAATATPATDELTLLVGPEGGFSEDEIAYAAKKSARRVALGTGILRVETAAVALLALTSLTGTGSTR